MDFELDRGPARVPRAAAVLRRPGDHPGRPGVGAGRAATRPRSSPAWPRWACSASPCPRSTAASTSTRCRSRWSSRRSPRGWMGIAGILGSHSLACRMIAMHGTEEQKQAYLPDLATGERRTGIGLTEPDAGTDLQGIRTTARLDGDHYVVNGTKMWITNARYADPLPVLVKTDPTAIAGAQGHERAAGRGGHCPASRSPATSRSSATRAPSPARSSLDRRPGAGRDRLLGGVEGRGMQAGAVGAGVGPGQHRRPLGRHRPARARRGAGVRQAAQGVRPADRRVPGDPAQARRRWPPRCRRPG